MTCPRCHWPTLVLDLCHACRAADQLRLAGPVTVGGMDWDPGEAPRQCSRAQAGMAMRRALEQRKGPTVVSGPEGAA